MGELENELRRYQMLRFGSRIGFRPPYFYHRALRNRLHRISAPTLVVWGEEATLFWTFVVLFGIAQGGALTLAPMVLGNLFGSSSLGSLVGTYWLIATVGALVGPPLAGAVRDATGTYFLVLVLFTATLLCAAFLAGLIQNERLSAP